MKKAISFAIIMSIIIFVAAVDSMPTWALALCTFVALPLIVIGIVRQDLPEPQSYEQRHARQSDDL